MTLSENVIGIDVGSASIAIVEVSPKRGILMTWHDFQHGRVGEAVTRILNGAEIQNARIAATRCRACQRAQGMRNNAGQGDILLIVFRNPLIKIGQDLQDYNDFISCSSKSFVEKLSLSTDANILTQCPDYQDLS